MIGKNLNKNFIINITLVLLIFFIDRLSKLYVISVNERNLDPNLFVSKYLDIYLTWNEGIAFGLFSFKEEFIYNFLTLFIFLIIIIIIFMILKSYGIRKYSLLLILGGAIGNFYDRMIYKAVPDFIDFHIGDFHWFIFNIADIFISTGVILMICIELISKDNIKRDENF